MAPIITSLLDTDLYKFTMWQAMLHRNPQTEAEYEFVCRTKTAFPLAELVAGSGGDGSGGDPGGHRRPVFLLGATRKDHR